MLESGDTLPVNSTHGFIQQTAHRLVLVPYYRCESELTVILLHHTDESFNWRRLWTVVDVCYKKCVPPAVDSLRLLRVVIVYSISEDGVLLLKLSAAVECLRKLCAVDWLIVCLDHLKTVLEADTNNSIDLLRV